MASTAMAAGAAKAQRGGRGASAAVIASTNARADGNRSAGAFAIPLVSAASTLAGTVSRTVRTDGTGVASRLAMIACAEGPV